MSMQLGANPKSKGKGKESKSKGKGESKESVLVAMFGNGTHGWSAVVPKTQRSKVSC